MNQICKNCEHWVEMGRWYVSGRLEPYGQCQRLFKIYAKNPCGQDINKLARVRWNDGSVCKHFKTKNEPQ